MAGARGIDSRFFASAPTQVMDPNAGIVDQRVMQHLTDTVMQTDRDRLAAQQADKAMAFRNREFDERSKRADADDIRSDSYLGIQQADLKRRQAGSKHDLDMQRRAEIADGTRRWRAAAQNGDTAGMKQALEELKRLGVRVEAYGAHAGQPAPQAQQAPPRGIEDGEPLSPTGDVQRTPLVRPFQMSPRDQQTSNELSQVEATMLPQLTGRPGAAPPPPRRTTGSASDRALAAQLSGIEADMIPKLRGSAPMPAESLNDQIAVDGQAWLPTSFFPPAPDLPQGRSFLPGQRPVRPSTAASDQLLSEGDPYNNLR